ncbi:MAG: UDP-N-acetylenolpyruvoylglucosamine reductase [Hyphomonadaceae bacterium]|nr:UDP-N-acetylenolpyruvoylglucosamine reductase [Hyphomonadaceae bacterium]
MQSLQRLRGKLIANAALAPYTWFRVGGAADLLFIPADIEDLADFLKQLPADVPVTVLGVGSNTIVRDGGLEGVVIRLVGRYWAGVDAAAEQSGKPVVNVRAGALDLSVAKTAAKAGIEGLSFLSGIPGSIGGAVRTNAGCYGRELKDCVLEIQGISRSGEQVTFFGPQASGKTPQINFSYRHTDFPEDVIITGLSLMGAGWSDPELLQAQIVSHQNTRAETQPIREKTGGSTFANPDPPGTPNACSSWKLIDAAGCRGLRVGGAQVSEKHCNFLINTGAASASDIEALGELVRARVYADSGVELRWEVRRIGRLQSPKTAANEIVD